VALNAANSSNAQQQIRSLLQSAGKVTRSTAESDCAALHSDTMRLFRVAAVISLFFVGWYFIAGEKGHLGKEL
jgi:hypothetical protein